MIKRDFNIKDFEKYTCSGMKPFLYLLLFILLNVFVTAIGSNITVNSFIQTSVGDDANAPYGSKIMFNGGYSNYTINSFNYSSTLNTPTMAYIINSSYYVIYNTSNFTAGYQAIFNNASGILNNTIYYISIRASDRRWNSGDVVGLYPKNISSVEWFNNCAINIVTHSVYDCSGTSRIFNIWAIDYKDGTATPPTTPDLISLYSKVPSDITSTSLFSQNVNITYNQTNITGSILNFMYYYVNSSNSCLVFTNGTCDLSTNTITQKDISSNITNGISQLSSYILGENNIYPLTQNFFNVSGVSSLTLDNNYVYLDYIQNISNTSKYLFYEFDINTTTTGSVKVYYFNSSYTTGNIASNSNVIEVATLSNITTYNHTHQNALYGHNVVSIISNTTSGKIGTVQINGGGFAVMRVSGSPVIKTVNSSVRTNSAKLSINSGVTYSSNQNTLLSHLHQFVGNETVNYKGCQFNGTSLNCTSYDSDNLDISQFAPTPPLITVPLGETNFTKIINITWLSSQPVTPSTYVVDYRIELLDNNTNLLYTLAIVNNLTNNFSWNTHNYNLTINKLYYIKVIANATNNLYSSDIESFKVLANSQLNITAYDSQTNASIDIFSVNITNLNKSTTELINTTSTFLFANIIRGDNYNITFDNINYAYSISSYIANQSILQYLNKSLSKTNSVNFFFYDEATGNLLTNTSCNLTFTGTSTTNNYNTTIGNIFLSNLTEDGYTATGICSLYSQRQYFLTVTNRSTQTLNIYLTQSSTNVLLSYTDKDTGVVLEGVLVGLSKMINGSLTLVESRLTDVTGRTQFNVATNTLYKFTNTKTGYITKEFTLNPVIFTSYNVQLTKDSTNIVPLDYRNIAVTYSPNTFIIGNNTFVWTITSAKGELTNYGYTLTSNCNVILNLGVNAYGGSYSDSFFLYNNCTNNYDELTLFYYYITSDGEYKNFTRTLGITTVGQANSTTLTNTLNSATYGMGLFERVLISTVITLILMGVVGSIGGVVGSLIVGMFILGYFVSVGFIPLAIVIITLFVGFVLVASYNKR